MLTKFTQEVTGICAIDFDSDNHQTEYTLDAVTQTVWEKDQEAYSM